MNIKTTVRIAAALIVSIGISITAFGQKEDYRLSSAHTFKNLTIFLIHGKDQNTKGNIMTLQEALERKLFVVYETSNVNELEVENLSKEFDVFIQSGDIVKGGKQDRVLAVSIIIPARSGRVKIEAFCVESGRWTKRGSEDAGKFDSSNDRIVTRELKIAANASRSQQEVWTKVAEAQERLADNVGGDVTSTKSRSSLQLALEDKKVAANIGEYIRNLSSISRGQSDVIGYAIAINGQINSADIYASNSLFVKLWPKMLKAAATEAVAASRQVRVADAVKGDAVLGFIRDAEKGASEERAVGKGARVVTRDEKDKVMVDAIDDRSKTVVHRTYVKKN